MAEIVSAMGVYDYSGNKLCDLYDSQNDLRGQAYNIFFERNLTDGVKVLTFSIPYMIDEEENFRWDYLRNEFLIRLIYDGKTMWYVADQPKKSRGGKQVTGDVTCRGTEV